MKNSITSSTTFDELDNELELLVEHLEAEDPEIQAIAFELFEALIPQLEKKIDAYVSVIQRKKANRDYRKSEAQRINKLAASDEATIEWLTHKLKCFMEHRSETLGDSGKKLEGIYCKISLCNNGGKPSVWINPQLATADFPEEYVELIPTLDTQKLIQEALSSDNGEVKGTNGIVLAKKLTKGRHIRIS